MITTNIPLPNQGGFQLSAEIQDDFDPYRDFQLALNSGETRIMQGVVVTASKVGIELGKASLWGIAPDSGPDYFKEIARELAEEAVAEAKEKLEELCALSALESTHV